jgi:hypothetical protein
MKLAPGKGYVALHPIDEDREIEMSYDDNANACTTFSKIGLLVSLLSLLGVIVSHCVENNPLVYIGESKLRDPPKPALDGPHHVPGWEPLHGDGLFPHHPHAEPVKNDKGGKIITHHYDPPGPLHDGPEDSLEGRIDPPVAPMRAFHWPGLETRHHKNVIRHNVPGARHRDTPSLRSKLKQPPHDILDSIKDTPQDVTDIVETEIKETFGEEEEDAVVEKGQVDQP